MNLRNPEKKKLLPDLDEFISGDASAEDEKKTIHVIIENGNTDTDNGTQITDPVIDSGDYSAGGYCGVCSSVPGIFSSVGLFFSSSKGNVLSTSI